jgi:hypothetical protein
MRVAPSPVQAVAAVIGLVALAALGWFLIGRGGEPARWTSRSAETAVRHFRWDDDRIVFGARCLALDPHVQGSGSAETAVASRFDCQLAYVTRPASVAQDRWDALRDAVRSDDVAGAMEILGLQPGASAAQFEAASRPWGIDGSRTVRNVVGVKTTSSTGWRRNTARFDATTFALADRLRSALLGAIPAVEAFYADHHTYSGVTTTALRAIDPGVDAHVLVVGATDSAYCAEIERSGIVWSERGPGGAPETHSCPS